ncbi:hypothetical protein T09_14394 [Trichinella sp. T9]|uniref:Secreted protein n=1 Tax=Trichinella murrelli TaxID=144512 RepID=A0A0V0U3C2_9BILA|nr:hypothetical protein T05_14584 [Trichinella murrelli]KRX45771.1 hypothetical protein T05_16432 [Trichinella murrelli]KRX60618.1 hypothetical protein T09_14394 [Trichinella sp. T9]
MARTFLSFFLLQKIVYLCTSYTAANHKHWSNTLRHPIPLKEHSINNYNSNNVLSSNYLDYLIPNLARHFTRTPTSVQLRAAI